MSRRTGMIIAAAVAALRAAMPAAAADAPAWQPVHLSHDGTSYDFPVYANHPLAGDLGGIERIVLVQHGILRNGDAYFASGMAQLQASGVDPAKVLLLAPNFPAKEDRGFSGMPLWHAGGAHNWAGGDESLGFMLHVSSFQVLDDLLAQLADRKRMPALRSVTLAGHSAGAQMVQRYAVLNNVDETLRARGVDVRYVIANPSSYLYLAPERPRGAAFAVPEAGVCPDYDHYRYGLQDAVPYARGRTGRALFERYAARDVTYLNGARDDDPNHAELDKRCAAELEGANRLERGRAYQRSERALAGSTTALHRSGFEVVGVGHDEARMFGSQCGRSALFGVPPASGEGAACVPVDLGVPAQAVSAAAAGRSQ